MKHRSATALIVILLACLGSFLIVVVSAAPGDADTTFNGTGHARLGFGQGDDEGNAIAAQADGKLVVVGTSRGFQTILEVMRYNTDGSLDTMFGGLGIGKIRLFTFQSGFIARAVKIQADGKMVIAGTANEGGNLNFGLLRLNTDGSRDTTFGNFGSVSTPLTADKDEAFGLALQPDGKIVTVGYAAVGLNKLIAVVRYNGDGSLDTSFFFGTGASQDVATAVAIQSDGKILVAGSSQNQNFSKNFLIARFNADGSTDTSWNSTGVVLTDVGGSNSDDGASAIAIQPGTATTPDLIVVAGTALNLQTGISTFAVTRYTLAGGLDTTFDGDGKVTTSITGLDSASALAVQSPNTIFRKIVVAGTSSTLTTAQFTIVRYNGDGSLDTSFDTDGKVTTLIGQNCGASGLALLAASKFAVAGTALNSISEGDFAVARYNSDGSLDTSFDGDGKRSDDSDLSAGARAVAVQTDQKIVVAGECEVNNNNGFAVARYNPDGTLDTSFDGDGRVVTKFNVFNDAAEAVAIQSDGKIVVAGTSDSAVAGQDTHMAAVRYNTDGSLDASFGSGGKTVISVGEEDGVQGVAIQSDGKIVLGGFVSLAGGELGIAVVRLNSNGTPDSSFGSGGKVTTFVSNDDFGVGVAIQPNGKIVMAGSTGFGGSIKFLLVRYNSNGSLDSSLAGNGIVITQIGNPNAFADAMALQADGRILIGGQADAGGVALARYNTDGSLDTSFDGDGRILTNTTTGLANVSGLALQTDGRIIAAGSLFNQLTGQDFAAMRFNSDGSIDTSYGTNGRVVVDLGNRGSDNAAGIALDSSGRAVMVGSANGYFMTVRLDGGPVATPTPTPTPTASPTPTPTPTPTPMTIQFSASNYPVGEGSPSVDISITRLGDTTGPASVNFTTSDLAAAQNCNVLTGTASSRCDYETSIRTILFAAGETSKTISVFIIDDSYLEGPETFNVILSNPSGAALGSQAAATVTITDNDIANGPNPIDTAGFFVRLHYLDFLNREPDAGGFAFWTNEITSCGANQQCIALKRINVSAAFYISIEFQQTGYLVHRIYKSSFGDATGTSTLGGAHQLAVPIVRLNEFLPDTQKIGQGVIVGQAGWEQVLEGNKQAFCAEFVQRSRFVAAFPSTMTSSQFVDALFFNAAVTPSPADRQAAIDEFGGAGTSANLAARGRALRRVAENGTLSQQEFNRAFVLMQFFGYLRRNPNDPQDSDYTGYDFWLTKLNQFNGNFVNAEMVKAFITSGEYQQRFGP